MEIRHDTMALFLSLAPIIPSSVPILHIPSPVSRTLPLSVPMSLFLLRTPSSSEIMPMSVSVPLLLDISSRSLVQVASMVSVYPLEQPITMSSPLMPQETHVGLQSLHLDGLSSVMLVQMLLPTSSELQITSM